MHNTKYVDPNRHSTWLDDFFDLIFPVTIGTVCFFIGTQYACFMERPGSRCCCPGPIPFCRA